MYVTIGIRCDNAAFADHPEELKHLLGNILRRVGDLSAVCPGCTLPIMDSNGNTVGRFEAHEAEPTISADLLAAAGNALFAMSRSITEHGAVRSREEALEQLRAAVANAKAEGKQDPPEEPEPHCPKCNSELSWGTHSDRGMIGASDYCASCSWHPLVAGSGGSGPVPPRGVLYGSISSNYGDLSAARAAIAKAEGDAQ